MAEAVRILFTDKELTHKVLVKQLPISDPSAGRGLRPGNQNRGTRLEFKTEAFQSILDETAKARPAGEKNQPQDLIDRRYIDGMDKNDKLWAGK
jgi:hypothetical protein